MKREPVFARALDSQASAKTTTRRNPAPEGPSCSRLNVIRIVGLQGPTDDPRSVQCTRRVHRETEDRQGLRTGRGRCRERAQDHSLVEELHRAWGTDGDRRAAGLLRRTLVRPAGGAPCSRDAAGEQGHPEDEGGSRATPGSSAAPARSERRTHAEKPGRRRTVYEGLHRGDSGELTFGPIVVGSTRAGNRRAVQLQRPRLSPADGQNPDRNGSWDAAVEVVPGFRS